MNLPTILLIGAGVYLASRYLPTAVALLRTEFSYYMFDIISVQDDNIRASVTLKAENKSNTSVLLQRIEAGMTLNNKVIGLMNNVFNITIPAGKTELVKIIFDIKKSAVGSELWNMILTVQTDFHFEISGNVWANDNKYPLVVGWTMNDIIQILNPKATDKTVISFDKKTVLPVMEDVELPSPHKGGPVHSLRTLDEEISLSGIGASKYITIDQAVKNAWNNRQTGNEKIINDTLHYGVGPHPYAYKNELNQSGVEYTDKGSSMGYLTSKRELQKFVEWLEENDGYLSVSY